MVANQVNQPVVLLQPSFWFRNNAIVRGQYFELPNPMMASILGIQDDGVSPVLESTLVAKTSYYDGIIRTSLGTGSAPLYQSSQIKDTSPDTIEIAFDINVFAGGDAGWTVEVDASPVPVKSVYHKGINLFFVLQTPVTAGQVVTVAYVDTGNTVDADAGNFMATLVAQTVTNNVT